MQLHSSCSTSCQCFPSCLHPPPPPWNRGFEVFLIILCFTLNFATLRLLLHMQFNEDEKRRVDAAFDPWGFDALWELASPAKTIAKKPDAPPQSPPPRPLPKPGQAEEGPSVTSSYIPASGSAPRTPT